jgi:hypothetical protein
MKTLFWTMALVPISWGVAHPITGGEIQWATGPALQKRLAETVDIVMSENPLRSALNNLSRNKKVAVLIDRRVDPGQKIQISLRQTSLREALEAIAGKCGLGVTLIGPVAYFAPPEVAWRVRTIKALREEEVRRLAPAIVKKFLQPKPMAWDDLTSPRELLEKLGGENGFEINGLDQVPHDLWAAADLPPLGLVERLTLIVGQFDLTFAVSADGKQVTLLPALEHVELVRTYPAGAQPEATAKRYAALAPDARIEIVGPRIQVAGTIEDHQRITAAQRPSLRPETKPAQTDLALKRFTLTVKEKPLGQLLRQLAAQLNLELKMDDKALQQAGVSLQQRVSFSVKEATLDELLQAALRQTPLKFARRGKVVQIEPSGKK